MNNSNNLHILHGHVGKDPEIRMAGTVKVANFSFATDASYRKDGKKVEATDWHNIVAYGPLAELIEKHVKKGAELNLFGEVKTRSWDSDSGKKYITETRISSLGFCGSKKSDAPATPSATSSAPTFDEMPPMEANDLPF